jgi:sulfane dehydrogenase subunit SoxC
MMRSIPIEKCLEDALLVYSENGERLRPQQGYPLRLLTPGCEGSMSAKWLRRLRVPAEPTFSREETFELMGNCCGGGMDTEFPQRRIEYDYR